MFRFSRLSFSLLPKSINAPPSDPLTTQSRWLSLFSPTAAPSQSFSSQSSNGDSGEWTGDVDYLDEDGGVIFSGKGIRSTEPRSDGHVMVGGLKKPILNATAVAKIVELLRRWKWGPDLDSQLDALHFLPTMDHIAKAMKVVDEAEPSLNLFRWAQRQPWYSPTHHPSSITLLSDLLNRNRDYDAMISLFNELVSHSPSPCSRFILHLARAEKMEASYSCFKKMCDFKMDTQVYTSLITLFMAKGLAYKAFEVYERMEEVGCGMDLSSYELMVPTLARSGRLDAASKLFLEMKEKRMNPSYNVFASMVDSMGKAGRLDASMKVFMEMCGSGYRPSSSMYVSMVESFLKAGKLESARRLWGEMREAGLRPNFGVYTMFVESHAKSGMLEVAMAGFTEMEKAGFLPTLSTYSCLLDSHSSSGDLESSMKLYNSMKMAGLKPGMSTCASLLSLLAKRKLVDVAARVLLEMKEMGSSVEITASDVLMVFIKEGWVEVGLKWLSFMEASGLRTNNFIIRQLFESCMRRRMYEAARPLLEVFVGSGAKVDLVMYTSILAHMVRCTEEEDERRLMEILRGTRHRAHRFLCGMFEGTEERKQAVLSLVREFFDGVECAGGGVEGGVRYFVNVLLNYLVLMGQMNRARCVWKVAYEKKLFEKAIVFDQHIAWSLDVRNLSVGAAMVAVVHTLHRFRKRMLYYGMVPRRIKVVTGTLLKVVVAQMLEGVESPFEVSKVVLRAPGSSVSDWFKKPIVQQFLLNEIPSRGDVLMHKLNVLFPTSAPEQRSLSPIKPTSNDFKLKKLHS